MRKSDKGKTRLPIGRDVRSPGEMTMSRATYRAIFDSVSDAIILRDLKTKEILDVNRTFTVMYGYTLEEAKKISLGGFAASAVQDVNAFAEHYARAAQGDPQLIEWEAKIEGPHVNGTSPSHNYGTPTVRKKERALQHKCQNHKALILVHNRNNYSYYPN
jgi:PAS domain S-box-containing protein